MTGWYPDDPRFAAHAEQYQKYLTAYCRLAASAHINIVPGTIVSQHLDATCTISCPSCLCLDVAGSSSSKPKLLNIAYFISCTGAILGSYTKTNLWHPERPFLASTPKVPHSVISTPIGKVGLLVCWDLAFPEAFRELIASGAEIVVVPACWTLDDSPAYLKGLKRNPDFESMLLNSMITTRCFENTCAVVFANCGGSGPAQQRQRQLGGGAPNPYVGLSQVAAPFVGAIKRLGSEEGMDIAELDLEILKEAEDNYKVRADLAQSTWHYSYRHSSHRRD